MCDFVVGLGTLFIKRILSCSLLLLAHALPMHICTCTLTDHCACRSIRAKHFLISEDGSVKLSGLRSMISVISEGARQRSLHGHFSSTVDNICWLAPEVLAQDLSGYSFKSDTYSVGIAALELATGEAPFAGLPVTEVINLTLLLRR